MDKIIIVVEDNDDIREIINILLREEEYEVKLCPDAKSFRESISGSNPDLVILDVMLPDGNGLELCAELKSLERTSTVPVLIMSAHASLSDVNATCKPDGFIRKPFDINNFIEKVTIAIG